MSWRSYDGMSWRWYEQYRIDARTGTLVDISFAGLRALMKQ